MLVPLFHNTALHLKFYRDLPLVHAPIVFFLEGAVGIEPTSRQFCATVAQQESFCGVKLWVSNFTAEDLRLWP